MQKQNRVSYAVRQKLTHLIEEFVRLIEIGDHEKATEVANHHRYVVEQELKRIAPPAPPKKKRPAREDKASQHNTETTTDHPNSDVTASTQELIND